MAPTELLPGAEALPTLEGERVRLRWLRRDDTEDLFAIFSDPQVMRYWSAPALADESEAADLLEEIRRGFLNRTYFQWGVAERRDDRVVGTCTLWNIQLDNRLAEVGYALGRSAWGRGLMTEALSRMMDYVFGELGFRRLEADVDPRNAPSLRLLEKLAFEKEGLLRERWEVDGEVQDSLYYGLLARDWPPDR